jgi:thiol-disulfide isomerase/thioredoxin
MSMNVAAFCVLTMTALGVGPRGYVLEFSGKSCPPCQQMAPIISRLEREGLPIRKVDVEEERSLAEQYQVESIPTFILIVNDQEVERMSGAQAESRIRQMLAKVPAQPRNNPNDRLAVKLGDSAPLPRPEVLVPSEPRPPQKTYDSHLVENDESPKGLWPFPKKPKPLVSSTVRGNDPAHMPGVDNVATASDTPMDASVRLRVMTGNKLVRGSGTIIESQAGRTTILTCSHISRGATDDTKVEVDIFCNGQTTTYVGTLVGSDPIADIGLITIPTGESFPASPLASASLIPAIGTKVVSIGCGGGEVPSREQLRVTDVNRYKGPDTLVCTGIPVQGRSGGGLFDESGALVGVCFAADETGKSGVYCGVKPITELLEKHDMGHLVPSSEAESGIVDSDVMPSDSEGLGDPELGEEAPFAKMPSSPLLKQAAEPPSLSHSAEEFAADDAEVVVVIRSRSAGSAGDKVILIHKPSRKFLQFVEGEVSGGVEGAAPLTRQSPVVPVEARTARVVRTKPSTQILLPTGLETQCESRPNVYSVR